MTRLLLAFIFLAPVALAETDPELDQLEKGTLRRRPVEVYAWHLRGRFRTSDPARAYRVLFQRNDPQEIREAIRYIGPEVAEEIQDNHADYVPSPRAWTRNQSLAVLLGTFDALDGRPDPYDTVYDRNEDWPIGYMVMPKVITGLFTPIEMSRGVGSIPVIVRALALDRDDIEPLLLNVISQLSLHDIWVGVYEKAAHCPRAKVRKYFIDHVIDGEDRSVPGISPAGRVKLAAAALSSPYSDVSDAAGRMAYSILSRWPGQHRPIADAVLSANNPQATSYLWPHISSATWREAIVAVNPTTNIRLRRNGKIPRHIRQFVRDTHPESVSLLDCIIATVTADRVIR